MATSQQRCVFVGNIPYDATEEQLIQICEEVGPVVSFRLVIDRETGKPKGYGFCEYKDEETALSARRNLQGYEINGRQLRVDFAENDKNTDRSREQGRGGPGMVANAGPQKQFGGPTVVGDSGFHQPIGLQVAMTAASVMAGVLGGAQVNSELNQNGLQGQPASYSDPLTLHLAKMSRNQLNEVLSELKVMATEKKEQARQLLLANPQLPKALFQAQIMLGMVTPQMLQIPNIRQASGPHTQPVSQDGQQGQQPVAPTLPGLPHLAQHKMQLGLMPRDQEPQVSSRHPNSLAHNQYSAFPQLPTQARVQFPQVAQSQVLGSASARTQNPVATSFYLKQQMQPPLLEHEGQAGAANLGHNSQLIAPNAALQTRPLISNQNFQPGASTLSGTPDLTNKYADRPAQVTNPSSWAQRSLPLGSSEKAKMVEIQDPMSRPSKLAKLDEQRGASAVGLNASTSISGPSQVSGSTLFRNQISKAEPNSEKKAQLQLPPDVESALLQQVLSLTPEQLSSLPPDQQQQVIQLQQMLR